eukprot:scaffold107392_cov45-Attheya_sp.AAC.1
MARFSTIALATSLLVASVSAWAPGAPSSFGVGRMSSIQRPTALAMALDYNDPVVAEQYAAVQPMSFEEVEEELMMSGIRAPPTMNEMEVKFMLVEMRMRIAGVMPNSSKKEKPKSFSSKFEEAMWTKPAFEEYYNSLKGDHNSQNVVSEYVNDPVLAETRYGKTYKPVIRKIKAALSAALPVKSATLTFSGFPANMGEMGCKMTLEALGPLVEFECTESDDFPILTGKVTFEDIETAKKAVAQYNGMDMGMGSALELVSA